MKWKGRIKITTIIIGKDSITRQKCQVKSEHLANSATNHNNIPRANIPQWIWWKTTYIVSFKANSKCKRLMHHSGMQFVGLLLWFYTVWCSLHLLVALEKLPMMRDLVLQWKYPMQSTVHCGRQRLKFSYLVSDMNQSALLLNFKFKKPFRP